MVKLELKLIQDDNRTLQTTCEQSMLKKNG